VLALVIDGSVYSSAVSLFFRCAIYLGKKCSRKSVLLHHVSFHAIEMDGKVLGSFKRDTEATIRVLSLITYIFTVHFMIIQ
jgi:hypothetical protein